MTRPLCTARPCSRRSDRRSQRCEHPPYCKEHHGERHGWGRNYIVTDYGLQNPPKVHAGPFPMAENIRLVDPPE